MSPDRISDSPKHAGLPPLRDIISRHGLAARRSLGQHYLLDRNLTDRIAHSSAPLTGRTVLEIGPGPGGLTRSLLATDAERIVAVEKDPRCVFALEELKEVCGERLTIVEADALTLDPDSVLEAGEECVIVANLPYNIATPLLINWLKRGDRFGSMTLMFQKEVADRIIATPGDSSYGRLSVISQWLCETGRLFDIPARAFVPPPKVVSTVVRLVPRENMDVSPKQFSAMEALTRAAFGQRRKMLRSSLKGFCADSGALLSAAGISPDRRAETLSISEFCNLAAASETLAEENRSNSPPAGV